MFEERRGSVGGRAATPLLLHDKSPLMRSTELPSEQSLWNEIEFKADAHESPILGMTAMETHLFTGAHQSLKVWDIN